MIENLDEAIKKADLKVQDIESSDQALEIFEKQNQDDLNNF